MTRHPSRGNLTLVPPEISALSVVQDECAIPRWIGRACIGKQDAPATRAALGRLPAALVEPAVREHDGLQEIREHESQQEKSDQPRLHLFTPFAQLEVEVLQRLCRHAVEARCDLIFAPPRRQIPLSDPRRSSVARRRQLVEAGFSGYEHVACFIQAPLLHQSPAKHQLCVSDLAEHVNAISEKFQGLTCLIFRERKLTRSKVHLSERRHSVSCISLVTDIECDAKGVFE